MRRESAAGEDGGSRARLSMVMGTRRPPLRKKSDWQSRTASTICMIVARLRSIEVTIRRARSSLVRKYSLSSGSEAVCIMWI